ncbi:molybdopterin-dependent oxidoreductase [Mycolicibacterium tokaiense]|uniref:Sulfite oxidase-like oxidoreductase n=1 Tax=Mycolicibacterium tokaiense TaxID=39695 RepID=A0A378TBV1_9MYCO|nr:molybdopterin-dependent oxidoreductase [Mycolicibacterium tokaiense]BBY88154.1 molybdopterin-binding protein [Mycolicibacterium tokaiense]STZ57323.1 sulfite oxidase-like oxidoreductase [Mycolicibacterium tokaiense]
MAVISRGFGARRRESEPELPPGQYLTTDFPVLSAGPTPQIELTEWQFVIADRSGPLQSWSWDEFTALPAEDVHTDIHCVTRWSKLGTQWRGVSLAEIFAGVSTSDDYTMVHSYGGYTTNIPLADLLDGQAWLAYEFDGEPLEPEHGGPVRLLVPHLYFWKSAKWVRGIVLQPDDDPGFWEQNGYHTYGDPWQEQRYW